MIVRMRDNSQKRLLCADGTSVSGASAMSNSISPYTIRVSSIPGSRAARQPAVPSGAGSTMIAQIQIQARCFRLERRLQLIAKMSRKHADLGHTLAPQHAHLTENNRNACNRQQRLGNTARRSFRLRAFPILLRR